MNVLPATSRMPSVCAKGPYVHDRFVLGGGPGGGYAVLSGERSPFISFERKIGDQAPERTPASDFLLGSEEHAHGGVVGILRAVT